MHNYAPLLIVGFSATLLAGCSSTGGGGGGAGGGGGTPSPAVFAASAGTASEALADGETLTAYSSQMSAAVEHDFDAQQTRALDPTTFSIATNAQGALDVTIDGVLYSFAAADIDQWTLESSDGLHRLDSAQGAIADVLDASNASHHQVWSYWWDPVSTENAISGFAVVGTETMPDDLPSTATATYSGRAGAALTDSGTSGAGTDTTRMAGDLEMWADFNAKQISGLVDNIEVFGVGSINGTVALDSATISGTGFSGTITPDNDLLTEISLDNLGGTYSGKFYGAGGEEVAGVMAISGDDTVGTGFFSGTQD